jgi:capsular polysaccharide transport system permease protein
MKLLTDLRRPSISRLFFIVGVLVPVVFSAIYLFLVASPQYESESRFVVKAPNQRGAQISTFANLIQTTGLSAGQEQADQVTDFIRSRSALRQLSADLKFEELFRRKDADFLSSFPLPWQSSTFEDLYRYYQGKIQVGRDPDSGLIVLRTFAFSAADARAINEQLLKQSEALVNQLNQRARQNAISEAEGRIVEAEKRVTAASKALADYRRKAKLVDPLKQATGVVEIANRLTSERAALDAQLTTMQRLVPDHPSIPALRQKIASLTKEIDRQTATIVGGADTMTDKLPRYDALALEQEFATQLLMLARSSLEQARGDALRQQFYLERVVNPNEPDEPARPRAWRALLTIFGFAITLYFILWMFVVGILEHAPED